MDATNGTAATSKVRTSDRIFRMTTRNRREERVAYVVLRNAEDRGDALRVGYDAVDVSGLVGHGRWGYVDLPKDGKSFGTWGVVAFEDTGRRTSELPAGIGGPFVVEERRWFGRATPNGGITFLPE